MRVFRVYNGCAILGVVEVPATSKDALSAAEKKADKKFGMWDRLEEI